MVQLKMDIFDNNLPYNEIIKKYKFNIIHDLSELKTLNNICYFNNTVDKVNNYIHKNILNYKEDYFIGLNIKCRVHTNLSKGEKLQTNYIYKITNINKNIFTILNELENKYFNVDIKIIKQNFMPCLIF